MTFDQILSAGLIAIPVLCACLIVGMVCGVDRLLRTYEENEL